MWRALGSQHDRQITRCRHGPITENDDLRLVPGASTLALHASQKQAPRRTRHYLSGSLFFCSFTVPYHCTSAVSDRRRSAPLVSLATLDLQGFNWHRSHVLAANCMQERKTGPNPIPYISRFAASGLFRLLGGFLEPSHAERCCISTSEQRQ